LNSKKKSITIRDVANLAGVSLSTASNALNKKGYISLETKEAVEKAAKDLSYRPSGIARTLKQKNSRIIGFFVFDMSGPVHSEIIAGVVRRAEEEGYEVIVCNSHSREDKILSKFLSLKVLDACIVMSPELDDDMIRDLAENMFPVVALDRDITGENIGCVLMDNAGSGFEIAKLFAQREFKKIGYIGPNPEFSYTHDVEDRSKGFLKGVMDFGLDLPENRYCFGGFTVESGYLCMKEMLEKSDIPQAVFVANDEMAIGALRAIKEQKLKIPGDISLIGFDDVYMSSYTTPSLSTVRRPCYTLGSTAVELLFGMINKTSVNKRIVLPTKIILRESLK